MADGRHIWNCWKCYNSSTSGAIWTKLWWSHPTTSPTCPPWCGCHGDGRCLATAHWTFSSYGRLQTKCMIQFSMKCGIEQQILNSMAVPWPNIYFFKFKMADGRYIEKCSKCYNTTHLLVKLFGRNLGVTSHHLHDMSAMMRLPW